MAVEMFVYRLLIDLQGRALVVLADDEAEQLLHIWIGPFEAHAIARVLKDEPPPRPLTHDLLSSVIAETGYTVERVTITRLEDNTYFAEVSLANSTTATEIDARPSDAIALALRAGAPIYVDEEVLAEAAESATQMREDAEEIEKFKDLMSDIDIPENFPGRNIPPEEKTEDEE
ncbi:MAG: bifunctional nuclease family protein [Armatimonadetes bacterium]|nr:bifunctional nuclease family protein [Armatimonadota bacterium]